jgi:hypothetical protein
MLRVNRLPGSLAELLEEFRPCFTAPTFTTFEMLAAGLIARPAGRTVCGMLAGAGLGGVWHHSRAHRFFAAAAWSADAVGLVVLRLVTGWLLPAGAPVVIAVDDTMFRRAGRKVHAACWAYDGSLKVPKGGKKVSRGNTFVIAAVIAGLPFLRRPVAQPTAARLWRRGHADRAAAAPRGDGREDQLSRLARAPMFHCSPRAGAGWQCGPCGGCAAGRPRPGTGVSDGHQIQTGSLLLSAWRRAADCPRVQ